MLHKSPMSGSRAERKVMVLVGCKCQQSLVDKIDAARGSLTRSQFVRTALFEKLQALGIQITDAEINPPDRKGIGGPKRGRRPDPPEPPRSSHNPSSIARGSGQV